MMPTKFKLLILDYGGVYSFPSNPNNFNLIILNTFGRIPSESERQKIREESHLISENAVSTEEYVALLAKIMNSATLPSVEQFEKATIAVTNPPTPEMVELVANVRRAGIKVSLLSDMDMFEIKLTRPWGRYEGFDYVSLSAEAGMSKQDPSFFKNTLAHFGYKAEEALFVDDGLHKIEVARTMGIATLFADKQKYPHVDMLVDGIYRLLGMK